MVRVDRRSLFIGGSVVLCSVFEFLLEFVTCDCDCPCVSGLEIITLAQQG